MGANGAGPCAGYCQLLGSSPSPLVPEVSVRVRSSTRLNARQLGTTELYWVDLLCGMGRSRRLGLPSDSVTKCLVLSALASSSTRWGAGAHTEVGKLLEIREGYLLSAGPGTWQLKTRNLLRGLALCWGGCWGGWKSGSHSHARHPPSPPTTSSLTVLDFSANTGVGAGGAAHLWLPDP